MRNIHHLVKNKIIKGIDVLYQPFQNWIPLHTFRYVVTGLSNSGLDILLFTTFYNFVLNGKNVNLGIVIFTPHIAAFLMAFCITFSTAYYINRYILFQGSGLSRKAQLLRVLIVNLTSIALTYAILKILVEHLHFYPTLSKIAATIFTSSFSYITQTYFYFRQSSNEII